MSQSHWMCTECKQHILVEGIGVEGPDGKVKTRPGPDDKCPKCGAVDDGFRFDSCEG